MTCADKLYIETDIDIIISLTGNIQISDINSVSIVLEKGDVQKNYTIGSGIEVGVSDLTLSIDNSDITVPGIYSIKIRITDTSGNVRGLTPCPETLVFHK